MPERSQHETVQPPLETLLKKPSVTIYLDGLMLLAYDKHKKRLQAGIHTKAHFHTMTITVKERGQSKDIQSISLEHKQIEEFAPLFLYVEKREGARTPNGAAMLYKPNDPRYRQAFANVLDFQSESFHKRDRLRIKPGILAPLNILNGEFYAATLGKATRKSLNGDPNPLDLGLVSTRVAGDLSLTSGSLILRSKDAKTKPIVNLPLCDEKHYEVLIMNEPMDGHDTGANPLQPHFNVYYEALDLRNGATKYDVEIEEEPGSASQDTGPIASFFPTDPPCDLVWVSGISELPAWS